MSDYSKIIYVLIRYSILSEISDSWVIGRKIEFSEYREKLFDASRLQAHYQLFKNITIPSLQVAISRSKIPVKCIVLTSNELPQEHMAKLLLEEAANDWLEVHTMKSQENYSAKFEQIVETDLNGIDNDTAVYATVRLDDDDALADDFFVSLSGYIEPRYRGLAVSLAKGYMAYVSEGKFVGFVEKNYPKIAQGFSFIAASSKSKPGKKRTIYSLGNHVKVDEKFPVLLDARKPSYLWGIHEASDLSQNDSNRATAKGKMVPLSDVLKYFTIDPDLLSSSD